MQLNIGQITAAFSQVVALAALVAAMLAVLKACGLQIGVRGDVATWTYVAVACAAAKLAR